MNKTAHSLPNCGDWKLLDMRNLLILCLAFAPATVRCRRVACVHYTYGGGGVVSRLTDSGLAIHEVES